MRFLDGLSHTPVPNLLSHGSTFICHYLLCQNRSEPLRHLLPSGTMFCLVNKGYQADVAGRHGFVVGSVAPGPQAAQLPIPGARPLQSMVASGTKQLPSPRVPSKLSLQTASVEIPLQRFSQQARGWIPKVSLHRHLPRSELGSHPSQQIRGIPLEVLSQPWVTAGFLSVLSSAAFSTFH